ncbi:MAG: hypothetical protein INR71_03690 [Terriglobus roseus]|nr:hypothetical protein [Terriglobus roseus]
MPASVDSSITSFSSASSDIDLRIYRHIMADGKRQSIMAAATTTTMGRVATPKVAELNDQSATLSRAIGARYACLCASFSCYRLTCSRARRVKVQTPLHTLEGSLFTADPSTNTVAINAAVGQPGDYHIIPISHIQNFSVVSPAPELDASGFDSALPGISRLDLDALRAREESAVRKLKEKESSRNRSATKEGQDIYDNFARTFVTPKPSAFPKLVPVLT